MGVAVFAIGIARFAIPIIARILRVTWQSSRRIMAAADEPAGIAWPVSTGLRTDRGRCISALVSDDRIGDDRKTPAA